MQEPNKKININAKYEQFYAQNKNLKVYPTEFIVRTFLSYYPDLLFNKPKKGDRVLDIAFGDGRNTVFLCEQGFDVSGIEITQGIVNQVRSRIENLGYTAELRVGRNSSIPFCDNYFDGIVACHCCYYCDDNETFAENLQEYNRVLKQDGWIVASVACSSSYLFKDSISLEDGSYRVQTDPYKNREGYRLHAFSEEKSLREYFSKWYYNISVGFADNNYYGINEKVYWVTCQKK